MNVPIPHSIHRRTGLQSNTNGEMSDLWLSTRIVSFLLIGSGFLTVLLSEIIGSKSQQELTLALIYYLCAGVVEACWRQNPNTARWLAAALVSVLVPVSAAIWESTGMFALAAVPTVIGISVQGRRGAILATGIASVTISILALMGAPPFTPESAAVVLPAGLTICAILVAAYQPILQVAEWAHTYIHQAQILLDEARNRNAELNEVLTTLVHVNRQLDLTNERLAAARLVAERAQESKADFVAKVSHEFRTPLNMIIGLSEFLVRQINNGSRDLPEDVAKDIQVIHRNSMHLSSMINDVLNLSQLEAGHLVLRKEWVTLANEIRESVEVVLPLLEKKGLRSEIVLAENLPDVFCDPVRIRQIILNLVSNATRHTDTGYVRVSAEVVAGYVQVSVADTGIGIAPAELERIFEPFFHGDRSAGAHDQGSGLGLTVCKQLIEQHDGAIWATSEVGIGSTFSFRLPIAPYAMPAAPATGWINEEWIWMQRAIQGDLPRRASGWRIVVCDKTGRAHSLFSSFTTGDVELVETQDLAETNAQVREMPAHIVVVQEENPVELWQKIEEAKRLIPDTPIVGCSLPTATEQPKTPDVEDYLVKPVTRADLRDALESLPVRVQKTVIVDDDPEIGALFSRMLLDLDARMEIVTFTDGDAALAWMRANRSDLVLMDLFLPGRDGWSVLREKQLIPHMRNVPVIIISAQDSDGPVKNATMVTVTSAEGIQGGFIVESAFRLAVGSRERDGRHDAMWRETLPA